MFPCRRESDMDVESELRLPRGGFDILMRNIGISALMPAAQPLFKSVCGICVDLKGGGTAADLQVVSGVGAER